MTIKSKEEIEHNDTIQRISSFNQGAKPNPDWMKKVHAQIQQDERPSNGMKTLVSYLPTLKSYFTLPVLTASICISFIGIFYFTSYQSSPAGKVIEVVKTANMTINLISHSRTLRSTQATVGDHLEISQLPIEEKDKIHWQINVFLNQNLITTCYNPITPITSTSRSKILASKSCRYLKETNSFLVSLDSFGEYQLLFTKPNTQTIVEQPNNASNESTSKLNGTDLNQAIINVTNEATPFVLSESIHVR